MPAPVKATTRPCATRSAAASISASETTAVENGGSTEAAVVADAKEVDRRWSHVLAAVAAQCRSRRRRAGGVRTTKRLRGAEEATVVLQLQLQSESG
mmetsp:Transcript_69835/g.161555  ORF Transcript_69835/g.161555 Transcript_69835/m.161555 type:complete len:97 (+) Transcript_69835:1026-1316(+)